MNTVYAYRDAEEVVYVGVTSDERQRDDLHRSTSAWWRPTLRMEPMLAGISDRRVALDVESSIIKSLRPRHNINHNPEAVRRTPSTIRVGVDINGPAIRIVRERTGLTVTELAKRIGVRQGTLSSIESENRRPSPEVLVRIAQELKCDLAPFLRGPLDGFDVTITPKMTVAA